MKANIRKEDPRIVTRVLRMTDEGITSDRKIAAQIAKEIGEPISRTLVRNVLEAQRGQTTMFSQETANQVLALKAQGLSSREVAERVGIVPHTVDSMLSRMRISQFLEPSPQQHTETIAHRRSIAQSWKAGRYVVINDCHIRFHHPQAFAAVFALKGQFDGCIVVGDFVDAHWLSTFAKHGYISFATEISTATEYMHRLVKKFGRVLYLQGNHEQRLLKRILGGAENISNVVHDKGAAKIVYKALSDVREWYFGKWPGVTTHYGWFVQVGKTILAHADGYSVIHGRMAMNVEEHMLGYGEVWKLDPWDTVMEAHLHRHVGPLRKLGYYVWELPCMCGPLDYQLSSSARKGQVDTGWSILTHKPDGSLRFNESRSFYLSG